MGIYTGILGRAAAPVVFAVLAGVMPAIVQATKAERMPARSERLVSPLGAGGAADPIANAARKAEREITGRSQDAGATLPLLNLVAARSPSLDPLAEDARPARAPKLIPITAWSPLEAQSALPSSEGLQPFAALATIDPVPPVSRSGAPAGRGAEKRLSWAAPMLPPLLTEPSAPAKAMEVKRLGAPPMARKERKLSGEKAAAVLLPIVNPHRSQSAPDKRNLSERIEPVRLTMVALSAGPKLDPLGDLQGDASTEKSEATAPAFIMPFENGHISSLFNQGRRHPAIDLAGRLGSPVFSTSSGQKVIFAGRRGGYGNAVITRDKEGREHLYGHLSAISTRVGVTLAQGERLGSLGSTGYSTGPHVHYEVKDRRGAYINPVTLLFPGRGVSAGYRWAGTGLPGRQASGPTVPSTVR